MYKIISGLLSLIFLCVFTAPLGLAATKKTGKAPARKTASKTVTSRKTGKAVPAARQKTVSVKGEKQPNHFFAQFKKNAGKAGRTESTRQPEPYSRILTKRYP